MTHKPPTAAPGTLQPHSSILPKAIVWFAVQLVALIMAGVNVPLWARGSSPTTKFALDFMLVAQVATSSLLFPWLLGPRRAAVVMVLVAIAFAGGAGWLSGAGIPRTVEAGLGVAIWLVALGLWLDLLNERISRLLGVLSASCLTIGSANFAYLWVEFREGTLPQGRPMVWSVIVCVLIGAVVAHLRVARRTSDKLSTI
jgi:hypothetical protein